MPGQPPAQQPPDSMARDAVSLERSGPFVLPAALADRYRVLRRLPTRKTEVDLLVVEAIATPGQRMVARLYRPGVQPRSELFRRIGASLPRHVAQLLEHGQSDGMGYELLEYAEHGSLRELMAPGPVAETQVREMLIELGAALAELHRRNILHRNLKPENVLVRGRRPLQLALTDFGIASLGDATPRFAAANRTMQYEAPETVTGIVGAAADYWSLGMMLAEALAGRHPFAGLSGTVILYQLTARAVPLEGLAEPWRTLCRGLVLRDPKQRWGPAEIRRWLVGDARLLIPMEVVQPEAKTFRPRRFYRLGGVECRTGRELAEQIAKHWDVASKDLARGLIAEWLRGDLEDRDVARAALEVLDAQDASTDEQLLRLLVKLAPDLPPVWKGWSLAVDDLVAAAHAANRGDEANRELLLELYRGEILGVYASAGNEECRRVEALWREAGSEYERTWQTALAYGVPAKVQPDFPAVLPDLLLAATLPAFCEELRKEARTLVQRLAHPPSWLEGLLESSPGGGGALALRKIVRWLSSAIEIQQTVAPQLESLLKEFAILHRSPDFNDALDRFDRDLRDGNYASAQVMEQALNQLKGKAQPLVDVLRQYYATWEQIAMNSAACLVLRPWQSRLAAPRYRDAEALRRDLTRPLRWRVIVEGWERLTASSLGWEYEHARLAGSTKGKNSVAFSPDGSLLASGSGDRSVRLWRVASGECAATLAKHVGSVNAVAFSPDGQWLASGGADRTVRLWQVTSGRCAAVLSGHVGVVNAVAFSPDGRWLASGGGDRTVRLWQVDLGQCVATLSGHEGGVSAVAFGPGGQLLASGGGDRTVRLWRVDLGQCVATLSGRAGRVNAVAFSPDGRWLASGHGSFSERRREDDAVRLWRLENRQCLASFPGHTGSVNAVAFGPDGRLLASGSGDRTVRLWRLENRQCVATLPGHIGGVNAVAFGPDGEFLASGCDDGVVLWSRRQFAIAEMSLEELIAWEKGNAGKYREIELLKNE